MSTSGMSLDHALMIIAGEAAQQVGVYLRKVFRAPLEVFLKAGIHDPVTIHDRYIEARLQYLLGKAVPASRILGEETGEHVLEKAKISAAGALTLEQIQRASWEGGSRQGAEQILTEEFPWELARPEQREHAPGAGEIAYATELVKDLGARVRWIVDPIDGTANFASGVSYFNTSIGVELDGKMVAGVVYVPYTRELFIADATNATLYEGEHATEMYADNARLESEGIITGYFPFRDKDPQRVETSWKMASRLADAYATVHSPGAGALDLAQVAAGHTAVAFGTAMRPWDVAAGIHLVRVAGGTVHTFQTRHNREEPEYLRGAFVASARDLDPFTARAAVEQFIRAFQ
ncbi:inositol monophosphatase family protein [Varibaculum vaginae]|uniref:inositol monophosphatase family protein n=1 Tax=Varibaculum vaginae TaxID=2364797 RepID=UPI001359E836|nr:inositol monophosphatase [Varibaculum vaginae]